MKDAVADIRPFDDPVPPEATNLDVVTFLFYYHDTTYMNVDRAAMDRKLFAALKPGGVLVIADHAALPGQGTSVGKTLHRIEEATLRQEVEAAGFHVVAEGNFWRNPGDTHDFPSYKPTVPVDNFVLKFQKPM
jgi:predicted methyltransferase